MPAPTTQQAVDEVLLDRRDDCVLRILADTGAATAQEIAKAMNRSHKVGEVQEHLVSMCRRGLLHAKASGMCTHYSQAAVMAA